MRLGPRKRPPWSSRPAQARPPEVTPERPGGRGRLVPLDSNATLRLSAGRAGCALRALGGTLLVTQEGDPADHVLRAGDTLDVRGRGLVVVWALEAGALAVAPLAGPPRATPPLGLGARP